MKTDVIPLVADCNQLFLNIPQVIVYVYVMCCRGSIPVGNETGADGTLPITYYDSRIIAMLILHCQLVQIVLECPRLVIRWKP